MGKPARESPSGGGLHLVQNVAAVRPGRELQEDQLNRSSSRTAPSTVNTLLEHGGDLLESLGRARKASGASTQKVVLPGVNHLLVPARTGEIDEYASLV